VAAVGLLIYSVRASFKTPCVTTCTWSVLTVAGQFPPASLHVSPRTSPYLYMKLANPLPSPKCIFITSANFLNV